jgi:hypothetical protein
MGYCICKTGFVLGLLGSAESLNISSFQHFASALYALFGKRLAGAQFAKNTGFLVFLFILFKGGKIYDREKLATCSDSQIE